MGQVKVLDSNTHGSADFRFSLNLISMLYCVFCCNEKKEYPVSPHCKWTSNIPRAAAIHRQAVPWQWAHVAQKRHMATDDMVMPGCHPVIRPKGTLSQIPDFAFQYLVPVYQQFFTLNHFGVHCLPITSFPF